MLAEPGKEPFDDPRWIYEPKWDGVRIVAYVRDARARLLSRNLQNFTGLFASIAESLAAVAVPIVLDGEVVAVGEDGRPDFAALQQWLRPGRRPRTGHVTYVVFDCLHVNGHNLKDRTLKERQDVIAVLKPALDSDVVRVTDPFPGALGTFVHQECQRQGLEGVVAKRLASKYRPGVRSRDWRKIAFRRREEFVVGGYLSSGANRLRTLLLGQYDRKGKLVYAGTVGSGFSSGMRKVVLDELKAARADASPFVPVPLARDYGGGAHAAPAPRWVNPTLVVEVEYRERLKDGLRHALFKALRRDKRPRQAHP